MLFCQGSYLFQTMKWASFLCCLGLTLMLSGVETHKSFRDAMPSGRSQLLARSHVSSVRNHQTLQGWQSDNNTWNENLYPIWKTNDSKWKNYWRGGKVIAHLTSDSPALVGSNVTFSVTLQFPRCQKENKNGDLVYDDNCKSDSSVFPGEFVYNWTSWLEQYGWGVCSNILRCNVFPDGKPFPFHRDWRRRNFVFVFHTLGQYYQKTSSSSATISLNTMNITLGTHLMEVAVYHKRRYRNYIPVATVTTLFDVTDKIPFFVQISQKNDVNIFDKVFIKDLKVIFDVRIHDPSNYLKNSNVSYKWDFGDSRRLASNSSVVTHTYTRVGKFHPQLTIRAIIPVPCGPVTQTPFPFTSESTTASATTTEQMTSQTTRDPTTMTSQTTPFTVTPSLPTTFAIKTSTRTAIPTSAATETSTETKTSLPTARFPQPAGCQLYRYGQYNTSLIIVEGITSVSIVQVTSVVEVSASQVTNAIMEFVVTCQGGIPTDVCTIILDFSCTTTKDVFCDSVPPADKCQLTLQRAFNQTEPFCVNITLSDGGSLAATSTLVSIGKATRNTMLEAVLIVGGFLGFLVIIIAAVYYKRYKAYTPVDGNGQNVVHLEGLSVYFNRLKAILLTGNEEQNLLLKETTGI
ncbi:protein QNR-71 [Latimeria chalumnae]|uniref:protein QNR-71 n=1 Tax=Latimeria chalumnae TaxID=7897 RepID=UPI00313E9D86